MHGSGRGRRPCPGDHHRPLTIASNGTYLCGDGLGHGDAMHVESWSKVRGFQCSRFTRALAGWIATAVRPASFYFNITSPGH